jgi:hypothetical protein
VYIKLSELIDAIRNVTSNDTFFDKTGKIIDGREIRNAIQNISNLYTKLDKEIKERLKKHKTFTQKISKFDVEFQKYKDQLDRQLEKELNTKEKELLKKYSIEPAEQSSFDATLAVNKKAEETTQTEASEILKAKVRDIRAYVQQTTDIPTEIIESAQLVITTAGRTLSVSRSQKGYYNLSQEGFEILRQNPELLERLQEMQALKFVEPENKVLPLNDKIPELKSYFSEYTAKADKELKSLEDVKADMNEGINSMISATYKLVLNKFRTFTDKVDSMFNNVIKKFVKENSVEIERANTLHTKVVANKTKIAEKSRQFIVKYKEAEAKYVKTL